MNITIEDFDNLTREVRALKLLTLNLRDIVEDGLYSNDIHNDAIQERHIEDGIITKNKINLTMDDIKDGFVYGRLLGTSITAGKVLLSEATGSLDDLADGTYGKLLSTSLTDGLALLSACDGDLDDITNGTTYGKVKVTNISSGNILLAECTGDLDNIADGTDFGKVALTSISAGKIIIAGLDSGITDRMFQDLNTKTNIEAWRHTSDVTMIDGGDIYANSLTLVGTASDFDYGSLGGTKPPTDADKTSTHTSADTSAVNGLAASKISGWAHGSDTTKIDGGDIYTNTVTATQIYTTSLSVLSANMGTLTSGTITGGTINGARFYCKGTGTQDIVFATSGISMYDCGGQCINFYKSGYDKLQLGVGTATVGISNVEASGNMEVGVAGTGYVKLSTIGYACYLYNSGSFRIPVRTTAPTSHQGDLGCNSSSDWFVGYISDWEHFQTTDGW